MTGRFSDSARSITRVTAPIVNTGSDINPVIGIDAATTGVAGSLSAADKAKIDGIVDAVGHFVGVRAFNGSNISIPNNTFTSLTFNSHQFIGTSAAVHSTSSNTNRFVADREGWWRLTAHVVWAVSSAGTQRLLVTARSSGALNGVHKMNVPAAGEGAQGTVVTLDYYAINEWAEVQVYQDSGGALNALAVGNYGLHAIWELVGRA